MFSPVWIMDKVEDRLIAYQTQYGTRSEWHCKEPNVVGPLQICCNVTNHYERAAGRVGH